MKNYSQKLEQHKKQIEKKFKKALKEANPLINKKMKEARKAIDEATQIAEKYGVPFMASVSPAVQPYVPNSFVEKFIPEELSAHAALEEENDLYFDLKEFVSCQLPEEYDLITNNLGWYNDGSWINSQFC